MSQLNLNKVKQLQLIKEAEVLKEWQPQDTKEKELTELVKKYPGMRFNKNLQNQLEMLRKNQNVDGVDQADLENCVRGRDLYQLADATNLLAQSEEDDGTVKDFINDIDPDLSELDSQRNQQDNSNGPNGDQVTKVVADQSGNQSLTQLEKV